MKILTTLLLSLLLSTTPIYAAETITGAGSTFIYPVLSKWADSYKTETGNSLNYQSIGSGGGIKQIEASTVTFGATDKPLSHDELIKNNLIQFPAVMGGIVFVVNIPGVSPGKLILDGVTAANIFDGTITNWNDPEIASLNPNIKLPDLPIVVAHRADGSGTTFNLSYFLDEVSIPWHTNIGADTSLDWPVGVGAKGNEGVAGVVKTTIGAIGYVEYAYAQQNSLTYTALVNANGKTVEPSLDTFTSASENADWKDATDFNVILANQKGDTSWPITATTWILIHKPFTSNETVALTFFDWVYTKGKADATALNYVNLPDTLVQEIETSWEK